MRFRIPLFLLSLAMVCGPAVAAPSFSFEATEEISSGNREVIESAFHQAFGLAKYLPPSRGNPLVSRLKRRVHFVLTVSGNSVAIKYGQTDSYLADAFTLTDPQVDTEEALVTYIFLLVDRIFWDESSHQRPDAFVRLITAIGHELYGNLPDHLKVRPRQVFDNSYETKQKDEITAHKGGVSFLNRLMKSELSEGLDTVQLEEALAREKTALKEWQEGTACGGRIAQQTAAPRFFVITRRGIVPR